MSKRDIVWFEEIDRNDVGLVGGKGANLGEMLNAGFPVPYGFVVTSNAYFTVIEENRLSDQIQNILSFVNFENPSELHASAISIQKLIRNAHVPKEILVKIARYYENLATREAKILKHQLTTAESIKKTLTSPFVAVRSSATAEDLPEASFAGQQETFLNIRGENYLINKIRDCWASLFTERAMYYRNEHGFDHLSVGLASVVQRMVQSEKSGIAFSINPVTNDRRTITIEAIFGLGEYIVQGKVTPDHYELSKANHEIITKQVRTQEVAYIRQGSRNIEKKLSSLEGSIQKLNDTEIVELSKIIKKIENHYYFPQDIEWASEGGHMYIVQSRPVTTINENDDSKLSEDDEEMAYSRRVKELLILSGDPASPGIAFGKPVVIQGPRELDKVKRGDVLVAPQTNPDYVQAMKRACAIVTEMGGRTSHAAIVSRELGIPAVVGVPNCTKDIIKHSIVTVNGTTGNIYKSNILITHPRKIEHETYTKRKTRTKIYVNLADPERAKEVAERDTDGIGLLRAEFMMADIGIHPKLILSKNQENDFITELARRMKIFTRVMNPRPVVYRATDFKTNEYKHLKGGIKYEPDEENPMLGWRGAARYITDKRAFKLELDAIRKVRDGGGTNLHLMIPFIRNTRELIDIRSMIQSVGLFDGTFKLWIMVEIPSVALSLDEYIKIGIDGVSIGTNDLTMLMCGADRDNPEVAHLYSEQDKTVIYVLKKIVSTCRKHNITCSICGQAASDYLDIVEALVREGITSLSVNIDAIERTREAVYRIEQKL